jgi:hypothetical protein
MDLQIPILLLSLLLICITSAFPFSLLVALVAHSDWLAREGVSDDALNLLSQDSPLPWISSRIGQD